MSGSRCAPSGSSRPPITFGTSGWRGILGEEFTLPKARALVRAVAEQVRGPAGKDAPVRVIVAHDTRFMGERLALEAAEVLCGAGVRPVRTAGPTPTPVATSSVRSRRAAAGILFTASHNPPEYQGVKLVGSDGAPAARPWAEAVASRAAEILRSGREPARRPAPPPTDLMPAYLSRLSKQIDCAALRRARLSIVYDALYGTGAGVLDAWLRGAGAEVSTLHAEADPRFGGLAPDPEPARLVALSRAVRAQGAVLGLASDGDADRFSVVTAGGRRLSESDALALLIDHLARQGRIRRGIALSVATGSFPERVARAYGLDVSRFPIGFKPLSEELVAGRVDLAGEESGGFAWAPVARDKDGILAAALLVERLSLDRRSLADQLQELRRRHGGSACGRIALPATRARSQRLKKLSRTPPRSIDRQRVTEVRRKGGLHCRLADGGFLMLRSSGTESVLRVYAEAPTAKALAQRLARGRALLG
ncbi:MAG: hypothetical protein JRH01_14455 [Deltaproteobacteria bacterium]|nr:hypothetical protein [Deltaproteobacteria bacterium]MBW2395043.1 hypothetical protein [Deltaproteobacteria bacterium]